MKVSRRKFMEGGVAAFTASFAAPSFLSDLALAQGANSRNLVVLYLGGGNDALNMLAPYTDSFYYNRRPSIALPAGSVLQIGSDANGSPLGLHPRLTGLRSIFNQGRLAVIQRTGYLNSSRSHFTGQDIWATATPSNLQGPGWLGRYIDTLPAPLDPLVGWATVRETPLALQSRRMPVAAIPNPAGFVYSSPNGTVETQNERAAARRIASHLPVDRPHLSFVNTNAQAAFATMDRVVPVTQYVPTLAYPNNGFGQALRAVAGAIVKQVGTKVFWVSTSGYDTHGSQSGSYTTLMANLDDGLLAFYTDLRNHGLAGQTLILQFSEFGRRINENASFGTDHGAATLMLAIGGAVNGGIYGTAASLNPAVDNPTLENNGQDVRFETDFRSVYARVIDNWLGASSVPLLGGDFRKPTLNFI